MGDGMPVFWPKPWDVKSPRFRAGGKKPEDTLKQLIKKFIVAVAPYLERGTGTLVYALARAGLLPLYQPLLTVSGERGDFAGRHLTDERWRVISAKLSGERSILDVGCNGGYFTLKAAREGAFCLGIERDPVYLALARAQAGRLGLAGAVFSGIDLNADAVAKLPSFDAVFCLSVYHHWVRYLGRAEADAIMKRLAEKCGRRLFFETGQPDESSARWANELGFMGSDPKSWLADYLLSLGFSSVACVGSFPTTVSNEPRHLFVAEK